MATHAHLAHPALFAGLNPLDWAIVVVLGFSTVTAFLRGLIRSVVSLVGVGLGLVVAAWYAAPAAVYVRQYVRQPALAEIVAFAGVFAAVFLLASLVGRTLRSASHAVGLGFVDRLGGAAFGLVRAVLVFAVMLVPLSPFLGAVPYARNSVLLPYLRTAAHGVSFVVPHDFGNRFAAGWQHMQPHAPVAGRYSWQGSGSDGGNTTAQEQNEGERP